MTWPVMLACAPVDQAVRAQLNEMTRKLGIEIPVPSIEHTITTCDRCDVNVWIGPRQLAYRAATPSPVVCYIVATDDVIR